MNTEDLKQAWQSEAAASPPPALEEVRRSADRFYRQIRARNRREYIAAGIVTALFALVGIVDPGPVTKAAALLVILGTAVIAWQLHRRGSIAPPPAEAGLTLAAHQRAQLVRQRDALNSVALWYLLPMVPGLALFGVASAIEAGPPYRFDVWDLAFLVFLVVIFAGIWWLNLYAARHIQAEIDELDQLTNEGETDR